MKHMMRLLNYALLLLFCCLGQNLTAQDIRQELLAEKIRETENPTKKTKSRKINKSVNTIAIKFENEDLIDIINNIAAQKGVNIILPQGANAINNKVTLFIEEKVSIDHAWTLLYTILDIAGYTLLPRETMYEIIKNGPNITREPLPLYIGMQPCKLPDTDQRIRYIYYLNNIKANEAEDAEINVILKNILTPGTSSYKIDTNTNGIIITAKADEIKAVMEIIVSLDKIDFQESLDVITLRHSSAKIVADLFNENILKVSSDFNRYKLDSRQQTEATFFAKHLRIIPDERTNKLILLGRPQAIERIKDFIFKNIDVELESGKSILHVYSLQYLDAQQMEAVLKQIVQAARGGTDQSKAGGLVPGGTQQTFDEVFIKADKPTGDAHYSGGNKLVVAARNKDWEVLERLIKELDTPQPQVLLEVLIADLQIEDFRALGSVTRNPMEIPLPGTTNFQSAQQVGTIVEGFPGPTPPGPTSIKADMLEKAFNCGAGPGTVSIAEPLSQIACNGFPTTSISFNDPDGKTWSLLSMVQSFDNLKVISHPHVLTLNNQKATVTVKEQRLLDDEAVSSGGTTTTLKKKFIEAILTIDITPRISTVNTVNLNVHISICEFLTTANNRTNREVNTVALVRDQNFLALGGLIRSNLTSTVWETPILSQIPIIGYFFKNKDKDAIQTTLTVFIKPTIIMPKLRGGATDYTNNYVNLIKNYAQSGELFDSLKDPINSWFFEPETDAVREVDNFINKAEPESEQGSPKYQVEKISPKELKNRPPMRQINLAQAPKTYDQKAQELKNIIDLDDKKGLCV